MAAYKKRVLAEASYVIEAEALPTSPPPKVLRLTAGTSVLGLEIPKGLSSRETFAKLNSLLHSLAISSQINVQQIITTISDLFREGSPPHHLIKCIRILYELGKSEKFSLDVNFIISHLIRFLKSPHSGSMVKSCILSTLTKLLLSSHPHTDVKTRSEVISVAVQQLSSQHQLVRQSCLSLIGQLTQTDNESDQCVNGQRLLLDYVDDQDARVRCKALEAVMNMYTRGLKLDLSLYEQLTHCLRDDYCEVRLEAMKLCKALCHLHSDVNVKAAGSSEELKLVDSVFINICDMINDPSVKVRVQAATIMGQLKGISNRFLYQTLDKKLISNFKWKKSMHQRNKDLFTSGEWSSGKKWADDAPREAMSGSDADSISLTNTGACGAFVHGLEDEYFEVRSTAVESLYNLAENTPEFARLCLDFIVDMFNDEIESVRLTAIHTLNRLHRHLLLREDQLETVLAALEDASQEVRHALHDTISNARLASKQCVWSTLDALLANMNRYSRDKDSIWRCVMKLGQSHSYFVLCLLPRLLMTHAYFAIPEPDMDDVNYVAVLILVFNACDRCKTASPLFPSYITSHYSYLRDSYPHLIPYLQLQGYPDHCGSVEVKSKLRELYESCEVQMKDVETLRGEYRLDVMDRVVK